MASSADVEIRLSLQDGASKGLKQAGEQAQKDAQKTATATEKAAAQAAASAERGAAAQRNAYQRLSQARERLGVRSETAIQREIQRTQAAYNRMARSGTMSFREQQRAAEATRQKITQLTNEMGKLTARQKAMGALKIGASIGAGTAAAAYTLKDPIQRAIDFDYRLAGMANTAFAERDTAGRKLGMKELEDAVNNAVKQGGGTREGAAEALDAMIASGAMSSGDAIKMLPQLVKAATASGADVSELANIGIRAMQGFGIKANELPNVLNMAIAAGQAGGFELRDMARWLPQQMAAAKMSGLSGRSDFAAIAALNQAAAITAGTKDEAGNNVANLLRKINSQDTATDVRKVLHIDLAKYLQDARGRGISSIDAFAQLIEKSVGKDRNYQRMQAELAALPQDDKDGRRKVLESMSAIAQGSGIGKIVQDQQAMMALIALLNNQGYMQDVRRQVRENDVSRGGAIDQNFALMSDTTGYRLRMARQLNEMGQKAALDEMTPTIGKAAEAFNKLAGEHTKLVGATTLAATALTAFAGVAGAASLAMGGKSIAGGLARGVAGSAVSAGGRILATGGMSLAAGVGTAGLATSTAAVASAGAGGYLAGKYIVNPVVNYGIQKATGDEHATLGTWLWDVFNKDENDKIAKMLAPEKIDAIAPKVKPEPVEVKLPEQQQQVEVRAQMQVTLDPALRLQNQQVQSSGGSINWNVSTGKNNGNLMTGAP